MDARKGNGAVYKAAYVSLHGYSRFVDGPKAACAEFLKECVRAGGVIAGKYKMLLLHGLLNRGMRRSGTTRASFLKLKEMK